MSATETISKAQQKVWTLETARPLGIIPGPYVIIISGPSGAGKTTLRDWLLHLNPGDFTKSISVTTRAPRQGERDGVDYFFTNKANFHQMVQEEEFLEWAEVHGHLYGTPLKPARDALSRGGKIILTIDVKGRGKIVAGNFFGPGQILSLFINPGLEELKRRLTERNTDRDEVIQRRLKTASDEIKQGEAFDRQIRSITGNPFADYLEAVSAINNGVEHRHQTERVFRI
jgi:guanylate kinase